MTLAESIVGYERQRQVNYFEELNKEALERDSKLIRRLIDARVGMITEQEKLLVLTVHELGADPISEIELDYLVDEHIQIARNGYKALVGSCKGYAASEIASIRKYLSLRLELCQRVLRQEDKTGLFEEAVRNEFENLEGFLRVLDPIITAEEEVTRNQRRETTDEKRVELKSNQYRLAAEAIFW